MRRALLLLTLLSSPGYATVYELDATFQRGKGETLVITGLVDDAPPIQPWSPGLNWSLDASFLGVPFPRQVHFQPGTGCYIPLIQTDPDCYHGSLTRESLELDRGRYLYLHLSRDDKGTFVSGTYYLEYGSFDDGITSPNAGVEPYYHLLSATLNPTNATLAQIVPEPSTWMFLLLLLIPFHLQRLYKLRS